MKDIKLLECPTPKKLFNEYRKQMRREFKDYIELKGHDDESTFIHVYGSYNFNIDNEDAQRWGRISDVEIEKIESEKHDDITGIIGFAMLSRAEEQMELKLRNDYAEQVQKTRDY
jgi:hypothetical protein